MLLGAASGKEVQEHTNQCGKLTEIQHFISLQCLKLTMHFTRDKDVIMPQRPCRFYSGCDKPLKGDKCCLRKAEARILDGGTCSHLEQAQAVYI